MKVVGFLMQDHTTTDKKQDKVLPESDKNSDIVDDNLHNGKNKSKT